MQFRIGVAKIVFSKSAAARNIEGFVDETC